MNAGDTASRPAKRLDLRLYAIVDPQNTGGHGLIDLARAVAAGGATLVQLRDKVNDTGRMVGEARALRRRSRRSACRSSSTTGSMSRSRPGRMAFMSVRTTWPQRTRGVSSAPGR